LIPLISVLLVYWHRAEIFNAPASICAVGSLPVIASLLLYGVAKHFGMPSPSVVDPPFSLSIIGFVVASAGAFLFIYGWPAFRAALFPIGFSLFFVPAPSFLLAKIVYYLQQGSSDVAAVILTGMGVPYFREGFVFQLPGIAIEVAKECSGIRSSTALLITTVLATQFFLRSNWRRLAFCLLIVPVSIAKNGLRIAMLSTLSIYVSRVFLFGWPHHSGGFVFFFFGLAILWAALRLLQLGDRLKRVEGRSGRFTSAHTQTKDLNLRLYSPKAP
jgi:exosortase